MPRQLEFTYKLENTYKLCRAHSEHPDTPHHKSISDSKYLKIRVIRIIRENPRFAAYSPKCNLHSDNLKSEHPND